MPRDILTKLTNTWCTNEFLLAGVIALILAWCGQKIWIKHVSYRPQPIIIKGPKSYPFIGSAHLFLGTPKRIFNNLMNIMDIQPDIVQVWFGPELFFAITNPNYIDIILNSPKTLSKADLYKYMKPSAGEGLFSAPVSTWRRHRKLIQPTFNQRILDQFVEVFSEKNAILVEIMQRHCDRGEIDLFEIMSKCSMDTFCETAMGVKGDLQREDTGDNVGLWIDELFQIIFMRMFGILYRFDFIYKRMPLYRKERDLIEKVHKFTGKIVREKRIAYENRMQHIGEEVSIDEAPKRKAFLDLLIEVSTAQQANAKLTDDELRDEVNTFLAAGTDTTASTSCFVFMVLGMYPIVQQKLYEEVLDVLGDDPEREIKPADLTQLKYLDCVVKETLRLFPAGAIVMRYVEEDLVLDDKYTLPRGSSPILCFLHVHRNPRYWPDPLRFDPDRFLPQNVAKQHPHAFLPFSGGPRNCIGLKYAMMAVKAMVAKVVQSYRIGCDYRTISDIKLSSYLVLRPCDGFKVSITRRNGDQINRRDIGSR